MEVREFPEARVAVVVHLAVAVDEDEDVEAVPTAM